MTAFEAGRGNMLSDVMGDVRNRVLQTFPERQIYLRSGGQVAYHTLSTRVQLSVVTIVLVMAIWSLLALITVTFGYNPFVSPDDRIVQIESKYQRQLADTQAKIETAELLLAEQRSSFESMAATIEARHSTLSEIAQAERIDILGDGPVLSFAEADILMAPTRRDPMDRVARRSTLPSHGIATGLPLDKSLTTLADKQNQILSAAEEELLETIEFKRAVIEATNMDVDTVLKSGAHGQGGPYIPLDGPAAPLVEGQFQPRTSTIEARLNEAETLAEIVETLPLGHPVTGDTMLTSKFGVRRDPFTRRPTHHGGIDFISRPMAPILATAPGTVKRAGWVGAYGNMVEIDHGNGFTTRYAHLKKIKVKRGQKIEEGEEIGGMGSTGRSTATHLHYEVRFQGQAIDPHHFLKAGQYVQ